MTEDQHNKIVYMVSTGNSLTKIAAELQVSANTVKAYCRRNDITQEKYAGMHLCKCCSKPVQQNTKRKEKVFCSDRCRMKWWSQNQKLINRKTGIERQCRYCGKTFFTYPNMTRKYCSHHCYIIARFGEAD